MTTVRARVVTALLVVSAFVAGCSNPEREKVEHVKKGDQYVTEKKDQFAVIEYASAIKIDPKYGDAHWKLAQTYERMNNVRAAFPAYVRAADALPDKREAQIKAIEVMLLSRRFEDARSRATALLAKSETDVEARLLLANAMAGLNDSKGALAQVQEALKIDPRNARARLTLGSIRARLGEAKEAETAFREAVAIEPASSGNRLALASFLLAARRAPEAEATLKEALAKEPKHVLANRMLAELYIATQRMADAEQPLKTIAEVSKEPAARFQLADYYVRANRTREAMETLTALAKEPAALAEAETRLALIDYSQGRQLDAHKRIDTLLAKQPKFTRALLAKAEWLNAENKLDEAVERARAAVEADRGSAPAFFTLAAVQERRGESVDAVKSYSEALRLAPDIPGARAALARLNLALGDREAALRFAEEARRREPSSVQARAILVRSLLTAGNINRAETEALELVKGAPDAPLAHALHGMVLIGRQNPDGARAAFTRALELSPGFAEAVSGLTLLDLRAKAPDKAIARLEAELARQPDNTTVLSLVAQSYAAAGDERKAEEALRRAVTVNPRFNAGYEMLARLYIRQNRVDEARAEYEAMAQRDPAAVGPRTMVGVLLESQGKRDEARKWYEGIVSGTQDAPIAANNLAYIYAEQGANLDMALQLATSAKPKLPDSPNVDDTIGWVYYKKGLASLAVGPLEASSKQLPRDAEVLYHLGLTYAALGDKVKARDTLTRAMSINPQIGGQQAQKTLAALSQ